MSGPNTKDSITARDPAIMQDLENSLQQGKNDRVLKYIWGVAGILGGLGLAWTLFISR